MGVTFEKVTKVYPGGDRAAVKNLSLEVENGELMVFIGPSGCGKTTTLRMNDQSPGRADEWDHRR